MFAKILHYLCTRYVKLFCLLCPIKKADRVARIKVTNAPHTKITWKETTQCLIA